MFFALFIGSLATARYREWGRQSLVILNAVTGLYLAGLLMRHLGPSVQPSYIFINIAAVLFFSQKNIKTRFVPDAPPLAGSARKSILVIDDEEALLKTLKPVLLSHGYSVLTATTGERGLQVARTQQPDLIVLDVILPGIKGREVCTTLKDDGQTKDIPIIFLTAKDSSDDIKAELAAGGTSHLTKPFQAKTLLAEITKVLG